VLGVDDDRAYAIQQTHVTGAIAGTVQTLLAIGMRTGDIVWQLPLAINSRVATGSFSSAGFGVVVIDGAEGTAIAAVEPSTGEIRWSVPASVDEAPLIVSDEVVVVRATSLPEGWTPTGPGVAASFRGLDATSGAELWHIAYVTDDAGGGLDGGVAAGDRVMLQPGGVALDAATGVELWRVAEPLGDASFGPATDDVVIAGGQDDPTTAIDLASGEVLWTQPGSPPYDDVWAMGDGGVFVVDTQAAELVAYDLTDGSQRWRQAIDPERSSLPWHVAGDSLFSMWTNLDVLATTDGSPRWSTDYPVADFPRMTGVGANDETAIVAFSYEASGGD
jgi:outer membrane protein assembly factor BamB